MSDKKNLNQGELAALAAYTERKNELVKRLFGESVSTIEKDESSESGEGFDGGAREPAPGPSDPEAEHNELVLNLIAGTQRTGNVWR